MVSSLGPENTLAAVTEHVQKLPAGVKTETDTGHGSKLDIAHLNINWNKF